MTHDEEGIVMIMAKKIVNLENIAKLLNVEISVLHQQLVKISSSLKIECKQ
jgi:hypothetical protein